MGVLQQWMARADWLVHDLRQHDAHVVERARWLMYVYTGVVV